MPLPLAPLFPLALRIGLFTAAGYAVRRYFVGRTHPGRTDQRMEDALDGLDEGLAVHRPADRSEPGSSQTNTAARLRRTVHIGSTRYEVDAAVVTRFRIRKG